VKASFPVPVDTNGRGYIARGTAAQAALSESQTSKPSSDEMTQRLDGRIDLTPAQTIASENAPELAQQFEEAARQTSEAAKADAAQQVRDFVNSSRKGAAVLRARFKAIEKATNNFAQQLACERDEWKNGLKQVAVEIMHRVDAETQDRLAAQVRLGQELLRLMRESEARLSEETTRLQEAQEALDERLAALEKPRGLKAVWRHLIGSRSGQGSRRAKAR